MSCLNAFRAGAGIVSTMRVDKRPMSGAALSRQPPHDFYCTVIKV
jgi:hypothetical protein